MRTHSPFSNLFAFSQLNVHQSEHLLCFNCLFDSLLTLLLNRHLHQFIILSAHSQHINILNINTAFHNTHICTHLLIISFLEHQTNRERYLSVLLYIIIMSNKHKIKLTLPQLHCSCLLSI